MRVAKDKVVSIDYTLRADGQELDSSRGSGPLTYLHGHGALVAGLERALAGLTAGESLNVVVEPDEGYGEFDDDAEGVRLPRENLPEDLEVGATYEAETEDGEPVTLTVLDVEDAEVVVDFNHPLAGRTLSFDVTVREVRDATPDELEHGHAHDAQDAHAHDVGDEHAHDVGDGHDR